MVTSEEWRQIADYPDYEVSDLGRVRSWLGKTHAFPSRWIRVDEPRILALKPNRTGYLRAALYREDVQVKRLVHLLVLEAFVGPRPVGQWGLHGDDDRSNNVLSNLRWDTKVANWEDRRRNGRVGNLRGVDHPMAKLTEDIVRDIRRRRRAGDTYKRIADDLGLVWGTVAQVATRDTWKHVQD